MAQKPSIPKGTRDFSPAQVRRRNYIFNTIREVFELWGFSAIETPAMENLSSLMGKYGEEGDRLLFKILNSGDYAKNLDMDGVRRVTNIAEKGLRYDLTVPFARYVVQHRSEITFPFKRYQIAPVWRADRPQKGRYREFVQCDVDVVGSRSMLLEVELCQIVEAVFSRLGIAVVMKINNRKILAGIASAIGYPDKLVDIAVAIDKLDKIGNDGVVAELLERGISQEAINELQPILALSGTNDQKLTAIESIIGENEGIEEMRTILSYCESLSMGLDIELDLSLARGLSYYTGAIFEVQATEIAMGSICGGGRYDDLTGIFGLKDTSGVGISFGAERIYDVMNSAGLFADSLDSCTTVLFTNFGGEDELCALRVASMLRSRGIAVELYPSADKLKKQFDYAESNSIPYMVFIGEKERECGTVTLKNLAQSSQEELSIGAFLEQMTAL
ncbi:MAG: histidine--tRNA ligase [Rikenellaceae bacterium]